MSPPPDETASDRIAHFRIVRRIGRGGQATVHLAEDTKLHRQVALKVMDPGFGSDHVALERFRREAEITSKLDNPGICTVFESGEDRGVRWIAMRYIEGESLAQRISTAKGEPTATTATRPVSDERETPDAAPASPDSTSAPGSQEAITRVLELFEHAARAIHDAHEAGVIHRDIKPGNMIIARTGVPVILDFGLAQDVDAGQATLTVTGDIMGTPAYMSPEQIAAQRIRLDRRTDVYSLAVSLYECLTLRRPFEAPTREALYQAILTKDPTDIRSLNPAVSKDLRVVVATAMEKDRDRRYQTALEFAEDLGRLRRFEPIRAKPASAALKLRRWARRNPALAASLTGLFVVLVLGLELQRRALAEARRERARADDNLADWERLADGRRADDLLAEADDLWPARPHNATAMKNWLSRARQLLGRLPDHRQARDGLRARALPYTAEMESADRNTMKDRLGPDIGALAAKEEDLRTQRTGLKGRVALLGASRPSDRLAALDRDIEDIGRQRSALEARQSERLTWAFEDTRLQLQHDKLSDLVGKLEGLAAPLDIPHVTISSMESRLSAALTVQRATIDDHADAWRTAIERVAANPRYGGLRIREQLGLIPLGPDQRSSLEEFCDPATGSPPTRGGDGTLELSNDAALVLVLLPAGTFRMGAQAKDPRSPNYDPSAPSNESPVHAVTLGAFFMAKHEMTQHQWTRSAGRNPSQLTSGGLLGSAASFARHPVEQVGWGDCTRVLGRLGLTLPTEAQWEFACRAGTGTPWCCDEKQLVEHANLADELLRNWGGPPTFAYETWNDGHAIHSPVGTYRPNAFGLHDMHGNVGEWCRDALAEYRVEPREGDGLRIGPPTRQHIVRGGGWYFSAFFARSSLRVAYSVNLADYFLGVRPARSID